MLRMHSNYGPEDILAGFYQGIFQQTYQNLSSLTTPQLEFHRDHALKRKPGVLGWLEYHLSGDYYRRLAADKVLEERVMK